MKSFGSMHLKLFSQELAHEENKVVDELVSYTYHEKEEE